MLNEAPAAGYTKPAASRKYVIRGVYTMENRNQNNQNNNNQNNSQNNSSNQNNNQNSSQSRNQK